MDKVLALLLLSFLLAGCHSTGPGIQVDAAEKIHRLAAERAVLDQQDLELEKENARIKIQNEALFQQWASVP